MADAGERHGILLRFLNGGRVAEIERGLPKILKSGGRAADGKDQKILQVGGVADGRV